MPAHGPTRLAAGLLALLAWTALILQLYLSAITHLPNLLVNFFSFFTVLTNLLVAVVTTWTALVASPDTHRTGDLSAPAAVPQTVPHWNARHTAPPAGLQAATAVYIALVGIAFSLLLRQLWHTEGAQKLANMLLHDVVPALYVLFWLLACRRRRRLPWSSAAVWLLWPAIYLAYTLVRGALTGWFPYPFLDPGTNGYGRVAAMVFALLLAFVALGLLAIAVTRVGSAGGEATDLPDPSRSR